MDIFGSTGLCSLEISRTSKGDYTYTLKTYFSAKGRSPEAAIERADRLRLEVERRLGLTPATSEESAIPAELELPGEDAAGKAGKVTTKK